MSRPFVIRTSDRILFRRCRRRWGWNSALKLNRGPKEAATPLWLGSGIHYALEDYHGFNYYGDPSSSLKAFADACRKTPRYTMPDDWRSALELGIGMMDYYLIWLKNRDPLQTLWINGQPQVEVDFKVILPIEPPEGYDSVEYRGALDRVVVSELDNLYLVEYKSAASFETRHLDTDPQVNSYSWALNALYNRLIAGTIYQQHLKTLPDNPRLLRTGLISTDKKQRTTATLYRAALNNLYGSVNKAPSSNIACLNVFESSETYDEGDRFIRRDIAYRNLHQIQAEGEKILMEAPDIINPNTPLYPNPTRECGTMCSFNLPCIAMDHGDEWEDLLMSMTQERTKDYNPWRPYLPHLTQ